MEEGRRGNALPVGVRGTDDEHFHLAELVEAVETLRCGAVRPRLSSEAMTERHKALRKLLRDTMQSGKDPMSPMTPMTPMSPMTYLLIHPFHWTTDGFHLPRVSLTLRTFLSRICPACIPAMAISEVAARQKSVPWIG